MYVYMYMYIYIYIHTCFTHVCMYVRMDVCMYVCVCIYIYIYMCREVTTIFAGLASGRVAAWNTATGNLLMCIEGPQLAEIYTLMI